MRTQLKRVAKVYTGTTPPTNVEAYYASEDVAWFTPSDIPSDNIYTDGAAKHIANLYFKEKSGKQFPKESVLMVGIGATVGKVCYSEDPCYSNQQINAIVFNRKKVLPKFGAYYLLNKSKEINTQTPIVTLQIFNQAKVKQIEIEYPDLDAQRRIVSYLDSHISSIDKHKSLLATKRDLYLRLKTAIINRAVTQGLNPDVKMKDSGEEWIGYIPSHWNKYRLKDLSYMYSGLTGKSGEDFCCDDPNKTKPYIPFTNVLNNFAIDFSKFNQVVMDDKEIQNIVQENDLIFLMSSEDYESIAKSAVVIGNPGEVYLNSFCRGLHFTKKINSAFINYQLNSTKYRDALRFEARGFTRINIKIEKISSMFVCLPPLDEQNAIVEYLNQKSAIIDSIINNIDTQIKKYDLFKRALINEVITGQRAV